MKRRHLIASILIMAGVAAFRLSHTPPRKAETSQDITNEAKTNVSETNPAVSISKAPASTPPLVKNPLAGAYKTAAFITQMLDSVPLERSSTREHLKGIQAIFFVSDYVMAAKNNSSLVLSESAIASAFTNVTPDTSSLRDRLRLWAVRPGTLTDHYQSISEVPGDKESIKSIKSALTENGVTINAESDLLMDCIRYAVHNTQIQEMYGANPKEKEATPFPAELNSLINTGDVVFRYRFTEKFGLDPTTVTNLMREIKDIRIYNLSPANVEIPVRHFQ